MGTRARWIRPRSGYEPLSTIRQPPRSVCVGAGRARLREIATTLVLIRARESWTRLF
jgi:hypothetical protein